MRSNAGFTLVEMAIVLVIVGLLLAGIIQGTPLINSGTAKNIAGQFKSIPAFVYQYQDRFRALPGDDPRADANMPGATRASSGAKLGNGRIDGHWDSATAGEESFLVAQHLRKAGLMSGSVTTTDANYQPTNTQGGRIGVSGETPIVGMTGSFFVCTGGVLGKYVAQIDNTLDDGKTDTGTVRAALGSDESRPQAQVSNANIEESLPYTVCMGQ